jgi:hypothetical protein
MPNPVDNSELFDAIVLAGKRSPGFVKLSGHARAHKWDVKEADGAGGAHTTYKGENVAQFTATFTLVNVRGTRSLGASEQRQAESACGLSPRSREERYQNGLPRRDRWDGARRERRRDDRR